jgi:hypothetical protein
LIEVVIRELTDKVETTLTDRRVDFPRVGIVQLAQLFLIAHVTCLPTGTSPPADIV